MMIWLIGCLIALVLIEALRLFVALHSVKKRDPDVHVHVYDGDSAIARVKFLLFNGKKLSEVSDGAFEFALIPFGNEPETIAPIISLLKKSKGQILEAVLLQNHIALDE